VRRTSGVARAAVAADAACLVVFVAVGRTSHDLHGGAGWFVAVLWPFALGWFAVAFATRLYTARTHPWWRAAATVVLGVTVALVLRASLTTRATPLVFGVVALSFLALATLGWRLVVAALGRRRASVAA
jgi:hypothetical protein